MDRCWTTVRDWCSGASDVPHKHHRDDLLARRMFYGGCLGLPWLWAVNVLYYRVRVYGPIPCIDGKKTEEGMDGEGVGGNGNAAFVGGGVPDLTRRPSGDGDDEDSGSDSDSDDGDDDDVSITREQLEADLQRWVRRSTAGAAAALAALIAWTVAFQVNRDGFGADWFVMDQDQEELSGGW